MRANRNNTHMVICGAFKGYKFNGLKGTGTLSDRMLDNYSYLSFPIENVIKVTGYYDNSDMCFECAGSGCKQCKGTGVARFPLSRTINNCIPPMISHPYQDNNDPRRAK